MSIGTSYNRNVGSWKCITISIPNDDLAHHYSLFGQFVEVVG